MREFLYRQCNRVCSFSEDVFISCWALFIYRQGEKSKRANIFPPIVEDILLVIREKARYIF